MEGRWKVGGRSWKAMEGHGRPWKVGGNRSSSSAHEMKYGATAGPIADAFAANHSATRPTRTLPRGGEIGGDWGRSGEICRGVGASTQTPTDQSAAAAQPMELDGVQSQPMGFDRSRWGLIATDGSRWRSIAQSVRMHTCRGGTRAAAPRQHREGSRYPLQRPPAPVNEKGGDDHGRCAEIMGGARR